MKHRLSRIFFSVTASVIRSVGWLCFALTCCLFLSSCAYRLSTQLEKLPGGVHLIQIPLFVNNSSEPGAEIFFTNAFKNETLKSRVAKIVDDESASEAVLFGKINSIEIVGSESLIDADRDKPQYLPSGTVLTKAYTVNVNIDLVLKKKGSSLILWQGSFKQGQNYSAPQVTLPVVNTVNSLYNFSAKRQTLEALSKEMMQAAFDRMVEDF